MGSILNMGHPREDAGICWLRRSGESSGLEIEIGVGGGGGVAQCKVQQWKKAKPWLDCKEVCPVRVRGLAQGPGEHQRPGDEWKKERKKGVGRSSQRGKKKVGESRSGKTKREEKASLKLGQSWPQRLSRKGRASRCLGRGAGEAGFNQALLQ